jgi:hypothetical protein
LYWYRTPPDVKVGREPFDAAVRAALEAQNPNVKFDWRQILETPIPSADAEKWRERRRAERSERAARQAAEQEDEVMAEAAGTEPPRHVIEAATAAHALVTDAPASEAPQASVSVESHTSGAAPPPHALPSGLSRRKRRRRRGGHGRPATTAPTATPPSADATPAGPVGDDNATDPDE